MKYSELKAHINSALAGDGAFFAVYTVVGDDDYLKCDAVAMFKSAVAPEYADFNLGIFSGDDSIPDAIDALYTFPVFDERKVVILTLTDKLSASGKDALAGYMRQPSETSVLAVVCDAENAKALKSKNTQTVDCSKLDKNEIVNAVFELAAKKPSITIDSDAAAELIERTQGSMARIVSEMSKLKAYCDGTVSKSDVEDMVSADLDFQIYALANAVSVKDANLALRTMDVFFKNGIRPMTVLSMLYDQYRKMLHAELNKDMSNEQLASYLNMKGGAVYYLRKASGGYSQVRLKKSVDCLHGLQYDVLSGRRLEGSALHEAVLELLSI